ncbi:AAA family ATPase [Falsiroseomonas oryziterrae]|uniref:AAA family ATPase n=1 Tax=Falsiroseomonas oryziterrae TaxID=2911368 RepID=UPI001F19AC4D|nr:AAA family ATPase [Roseomonas sp. NPKOSM-4]
MSDATAAPPPSARTGPALDAAGGRRAFVAFLSDAASEDVLRSGLADMVATPVVRQGGIRAAVKSFEREESPRILLVDVSSASDPIAELDALAGVCAPDTKVLVIGERTDIDFYREITRHLGADEYVAKPLTRDKVSTLLGPYFAGEGADAQASRGGRVVAVCGVRGGVGATTLCVNLAQLVAETTKSHVAVLDLHLRGGHVAMMSGVKPASALRHALENPHVVDGLFLERVSMAVGERVRIFAADEPFDADPRPTPDGVARVMELLRQRFNLILVDCPMPPSLADRQALAVARQTLLVFGPDMASLRDADRARKMVNALTGAGRTMMVLNRSDMPGALKPNIVAEALGAKPDVLIPDMPRPLSRAANLGRAALKDSAKLRRALGPLTQEISGIRQRKTSLLARLLGR